MHLRAGLASGRTIAARLIRHLPLGVFREKNFDPSDYSKMTTNRQRLYVFNIKGSLKSVFYHGPPLAHFNFRNLNAVTCAYCKRSGASVHSVSTGDQSVSAFGER